VMTYSRVNSLLRQKNFRSPAMAKRRCGAYTFRRGRKDSRHY